MMRRALVPVLLLLLAELSVTGGMRAMLHNLHKALGGRSHVAPRDCSRTKPQPYTSLTSVRESAVGSGSPPFPCVTWYDGTAAGTVKADTDLPPDAKDVIKAVSLGGHGYAGDGKYSDNLNNLLGGRELAEWNQPPDGKRGWAIYGEGRPWRDQILEFGKRLATARPLTLTARPFANAAGPPSHSDRATICQRRRP